MKRFAIIFYLLSCLLPVKAIETRIVGTVYDAVNGQPIPNVQIYFKGSKIGTTSNDEGFFHLHIDMHSKAKLLVSAVGYKQQSYEISPGAMVGMEVLLEENIYALADIVTMPGKNPALALMAQVRAHRLQNDILANGCTISNNADTDGARHFAWNDSAQWITKKRFYISDIQAKHLRRHLWRNIEGGMVQLDDSSYLLPLPNTTYTQNIVPIPNHLNFYSSSLPFLSSSFLSPLAASANMFYHFYLIDSTTVRYGNLIEKHYRVHFIPKNSFNPTLTGIIDIDSATFALRKVQAAMPREANINYLTALQYEAYYDPLSRLQEEKMAALMEMAVKTDTTHFAPSLLVSCLNRRSEPTINADTIQRWDSTINAFLQTKKPNEIIPSIPDSIEKNLLDSVMDSPLYRVAKWAANIAYTGYIPTGTKVDIGHISDIISISPWEKLHMGLPFRTNEHLWKHVSIGGYIGYGLRDRALKYKAEVLIDLPTPRRHLVGLVCSDRYVNTEVSSFDVLKFENSTTEHNLRFTSLILNNVYYNPSTAHYSAGRRQEVQLFSKKDWQAGSGAKPSVETTFSVQVGRQGYGNPVQYHYYDMPTFQYASLRSMIRLGWQEQVADFYMHRYYLYSSFPTIYLGAEIGSFTTQHDIALPGDYHLYGNLKCMARQDISLGMGGQLSYLAEAGIVLGRVPYPLLAIMNGNQGVTYSPERFTLMNNYQYLADRYVLLHIHWDGRGILFNQIPGIRYARLHELIETKLAYGGLSSKHADVLPFPEYVSISSLNIPYIEMGIGLGNIFRVVDVYSIWRLTHRDDTSAALWGIRFRFNLGS